MTKQFALATVNALSDSFSLDELIENLMLADSIDKAQQSLAEGKGIPHQQAMEEMRAYIQSKKDGKHGMVA